MRPPLKTHEGTWDTGFPEIPSFFLPQEPNGCMLRDKEGQDAQERRRRF
jgi:hypothetical protein